MVTVAAGPFVRGATDGEPDERPVRRLSLPAFAIDHTEVTVEAYAACVRAGTCPKVASAAAAPGGSPAGRLPIVGVSWTEAAAYCAWAGKRLPTEDEWEKAARGSDGRRYPWGDQPECRRANFGNFGGDGRCAAEGAPGRPVAVGSFPSGASPYGALDMAGNVWEWVADRYRADAYARPGGAGGEGGQGAPRAATGQPAGARPVLRVLRGGGCCSIFGLPRAADRLALPEDYRDVDIGFRCARGVAAPGQTGAARPRSGPDLATPPRPGPS
jgi:serine/threonine-protein kinase